MSGDQGVYDTGSFMGIPGTTPGGGAPWVNGGNAFGALSTLGTTDGQDVVILCPVAQGITLKPTNVFGTEAARARINGQSARPEFATPQIFAQEGAFRLSSTILAGGAAALVLNPYSHYQIKCYPTLVALCNITLPQMQIGAADAQEGQHYLIGNFGGVVVANAITITPNAVDSIEFAAPGAALVIATAGGIVELSADFAKASGAGGFNWKVVRLVP